MVENMSKAPNNFPLSRAETNNYRFERKFVFDNLDLEEIINSHVLNNSYFFKEVYERRTVNNIYFDDWSHSFYKMNVSGVGIRSKYRLRWYGDDYKVISNSILEIKKKLGEVGDKLLFKLPNLKMDLTTKSVDNAFQIILSHITDKKLLSEVERLFPLLYSSYERRYFLSEDEKFRITLDYNMKFYNPNIDQYMLSEMGIDDIILELKYLTRDDFKARKLSQSFDQRLSKNSKYVRGYDMLYGLR